MAILWGAWDMSIEAQTFEQAAIAALMAFGVLDSRTVFRKLIRADPERKTVEDLASAVGISEAAVAEHLDQFEQAGLVCSRQAGKTVDYAVDHHRTSELWGFLMAICGQGISDFQGPGRTAACG
jgi:DNA-binding transcriptional ArsR family regulator